MLLVLVESFQKTVYHLASYLAREVLTLQKVAGKLNSQQVLSQ